MLGIQVHKYYLQRNPNVCKYYLHWVIWILEATLIESFLRTPPPPPCCKPHVIPSKVREVSESSSFYRLKVQPHGPRAPAASRKSPPERFRDLRFRFEGLGFTLKGFVGLGFRVLGSLFKHSTEFHIGVIGRLCYVGYPIRHSGTEALTFSCEFPKP